jgi:hypothetical protein
MPEVDAHQRPTVVVSLCSVVSTEPNEWLAVVIVEHQWKNKLKHISVLLFQLLFVCSFIQHYGFLHTCIIP